MPSEFKRREELAKDGEREVWTEVKNCFGLIEEDEDIHEQ